MDVKEDKDIEPEKNERRCKYCQQPINEKALVCHLCEKDQRPFINRIKDSTSLVALIMVLIATVQILQTCSQTQELKKKRVEAEAVLTQAKGVLSNASTSSSKAIKKANYVFSNASTRSSDAIKESMNTLKIATQSADVAKAVTDKAKKEMKGTVDSVSKQSNILVGKFDNINGDIQNLKKGVSSQLDVLNRRNELTALADKAISNGDRAAFNKLADSSYSMDTAAEFLRIKSFYASFNRIPLSMDIHLDNNTSIKNDKLSTDDLIANLLKNTHWQIRGKCAHLLTSRKEKKCLKH